MATKKTKQKEFVKPPLEFNPVTNVDWRVRDGFKPTRTFEVGERVRYGNHDKTEILEVYEDVSYKIHCFGTKEVYGKPTEYSEEQIVCWHQLDKLNAQTDTSFTVPIAYRMNQSNREIDGLLSIVFSDYAGVDFSPEYQREYVWSQEDKEKLIDSIFNNITIGLFVFAKRPYEDYGKMYEVIDGKQRLTALVEFYEDRFHYKGVYYSQLSFRDSNHFRTYGISMGVLSENSTQKEKYAAFLAVNTFGKVMDQSHLDSVKKVYKSL
jgi:hypothetical protein